MIYSVTIIILCFIYIAEANILQLDSEIKGKIEKEDDYLFYSLTLPDEIRPEKSILIISLNPINDPESASEYIEFSNPNLYVSTSVQNPKDRQSSTWYSEAYGSDIVSIGNKYLEKGKRFYIGVHCQSKCLFRIKAALTKEMSLSNDVVYSYFLVKQSSINLLFKKIKTRNDSINFSFVSEEMKPFRVYITNKGTPSSTNTFQVKPSWISGYSIDFIKDTPQFCIDCEYRMIIESIDDDVTIKVIIRYSKNEIFLHSYEQFYDSISANQSHCYYYPFIFNNKSQESLIIAPMLFSGKIVLQLNAFNYHYTRTYASLPFDNTTIAINSEKLIVLSPSQLLEFKRKSKELTPFYFGFCIFSLEASSYLISIRRSSQTESLQQRNFLLTGQSALDYLTTGQTTKYRIIDFPYEQNLTISINNIKGSSQLYAFFIEDYNSKIYNSAIIKEELKANRLLSATKIFSGYAINIPSWANVCHNKLKNTTIDNTSNTDKKKLKCSLFAVVHCDEKEDCSFRLNAFKENSTTQLMPRTPFYNTITKDATDYYSIIIEDDKVDYLNIILNTYNGYASLYLFEYQNETNNKNMLAYSLNDIFNPNVIKLSKDKSKINTLKGKYLIKVNSTSFSSYSIYYYTKISTPKKESLNIADVSLELKTGQMIQDYLDNAPYKVFSYTRQSTNNDKSDIRITLTSRTVRFTFYVYLDLNNFSYDPKDHYEIKGYDWKNGYTNTLVIKKDDLKYSLTGPYYIVIVYANTEEYNSKNKSLSLKSFYLSITDETTDISVMKDVQHLLTLTNNYSSQSYHYSHFSLNDKVKLSINIYSGMIEFYYDFQPITLKRIKKNKNEISYSSDLGEATIITIDSDVLHKQCVNKINCDIYFLCKNKGAHSVYLLKFIDERSTKLIIHNRTYKDIIQPKEIHHYEIQKFENKKTGIVNVKFDNGNGNVTLHVDSSLSSNNIYKKEDDWYYIGEDSLNGKIIQIKNTLIDSSYLFKVEIAGTFLDSSDTSIKYSISYVDKVIRIYANKPYEYSMFANESQYFEFVIDSKATDSYHISVSSTNGEIALLMNYGETLPSFSDKQWFSRENIHSFINIDKTNPYFVSLGLDTIEGLYTLMVHSNYNTTFTLYLADELKMPLIGNNMPVSCTCRHEKDKCYFAYDDFVPKAFQYYYNSTSIVFSTKYVYGSGNMYARLHNGSFQEVLKDNLPNKANYQWSNVIHNKRNFLQIDIPYKDFKPPMTPLLLLTVDCIEKSLVTLNSAKMTSRYHYKLHPRRENIFYLNKSDYPTDLRFFYSSKSNIIYEFWSYTGSAEVKIYQEYYVTDPVTHKSSIKFNHISQFTLNDKGAHYGNIFYRDEYYNKYINFEIEPESKLGFHVKINYENEWNAVELGKTIKYQVSNDKFLGYFDIQHDQRDTILNVKSDESDRTVKVYAVVNIYKKNSGGDSRYQFSYPDENHYTYSGETTKFVSLVSIKIDKIPAEAKADHDIRVYFLVVVTSNKSWKTSSKIDILITSRVNYFKRIDTVPNKYYYSTEKIIKKDQTIFDLKKKRIDEILVIELSSCRGELDYKLRPNITYFNETTDFIQLYSKERAEKTIIIAKDLTDSNYYLSVWGKSLPESNCKDKVCDNKDEEEQEEEVEYLMYYYSTKKNSQVIEGDPNFVYSIIGKGQIQITLPKSKFEIMHGNYYAMTSLDHKVLISTKESDYPQMESLCFLSKMKDNPKGIASTYLMPENSIRITGLDQNTKYYINIMISDTNTNEIFTFNPITVFINNKVGRGKIWLIVGVVLLISLGGAAYYYFTKYRYTKDNLDYQTKDVRNDINAIPNLTPMAELNQIPEDKSKMKYDSFVDEPNVNTTVNPIVDLKKIPEDKSKTKYTSLVEDN